MSKITQISVGGVLYDIGGTEYTAGDGIDISNGELSVKVDGTTLVVDENGALSAVGGGESSSNAGTKVVTVGTGSSAKTSLQAVTNLSPSYPGDTRGNGAVDLQQYRYNNGRIASGNYSVAMGYSNTASGNYSVAIRDRNTALGTYSVAMGSNSTVNSAYSVAIGYGGSIYGYSSVAIGFGNAVNGSYAVAMGYNNYTGGSSAVALGSSNYAYGYSAVSLNSDNRSDGDFSLSGGYKSQTLVDNSVAFGQRCINPFRSIATNYNPEYEGAVDLSEIVAGSGKLSRTMGAYAINQGVASLMDFSKKIFTGILNVQVILLAEYFGELFTIGLTQVITIDKNVIVDAEPIANYFEYTDDNYWSWTQNNPDWAEIEQYNKPILWIRNRKLCIKPLYGVRMAQVGIDYTFISDPTARWDYYGDY